MNYQSPYDILKIARDVIPDRAFLLNARKVLLAKLELSGQSTILEQGKEYTKNDIERLFDQLLAETHWEYHQEIEKNPPLKLFLQQGIWNKPFKEMPDPNEEGFYFFIADWYASSYQKVVLQTIKENAYFKLEKFLSETHIQKYFIGKDKIIHLQFNLILELRKMIADLSALLQEDSITQRKRLKQLGPYYNDHRIACLNLLSDETFQEVRNEYGVALCKIFIELNNELKIYSPAGEIMRNLRILKLTGRAQYEFQRCYQFYNERYLFGGKGETIFSIIGVSVILCLVCIAALSLLPKKNRKQVDDTPTVNAGLQLDAEGNVKVVSLEDVLKDVKEGVDISYLIDHKLVDNPSMTGLVESNAYIDILTFYARGSEGYKTKFKGVNNNITPLTSDPVNCFEIAFPERFIGSAKEGKHQIKISNSSKADFLAFLFTPEGYFSVTHVQPEIVTVLKTNEEQVILILAGGGELAALHRGELITGGIKKNLPAFVIPYDAQNMKSCIANSPISYKDAQGSATQGLAEYLEYSYSIDTIHGRITDITPQVKLNKKYKPK